MPGLHAVFPVRLDVTISNDIRLPVSLPHPSPCTVNYLRHPLLQTTSLRDYKAPVKTLSGRGDNKLPRVPKPSMNGTPEEGAEQFFVPRAQNFTHSLDFPLPLRKGKNF